MELKKDLEIIAGDIKANGFENSSILITGSTGLLGSLMVKGFLTANKLFKLGNKVYALARNVEKANNVFAEFANEEGFEIVKNEITEPIEIDGTVDYIFHTACVTTSKEMVAKPVELIKSSVNGTINVLDFARNHNTKSVVYLSSMEVYGVVENSETKLKEADLGKLDLSLVRSCYPESKRLNENLCKCYAEEYGLNVCSARLTQTFGAGASIEDNRIFAYIAKSVISGDDIILKSSGKSTHDYCYTTDAISAMLILAKKGVAGESYSIANEETNASIFEMATIVKDAFNKNVNVRIECGDNAMFSKDSIIKLDTTKMRDLGWEPQVGLVEMYEKLIRSFKEIMEEGQ